MVVSQSPVVSHRLSESEKDKYRRVWAHPRYSRESPGLKIFDWFRQEFAVPLKAGDVVIDVGCGTGRASKPFADLGCRVVCLDHCLDPLRAAMASDPAPDREADQDAAPIFIESCLWHDWPWLLPTRTFRPATLAYCVDVLEHLPEPFVFVAVQRMIASASYAFLHVAFYPDTYGGLVGETLHLTVRPFDWWRDRLADLGTAELIDARDCMKQGAFLLRRVQ